MAIIGATNNLALISDFQGNVALPPIMARVSMAAAGATAVKKELWMTLDDFLSVYEVIFLSVEEKASPKDLSVLVYIPYFFAFSMIMGVLISR